MAVSIRLRREGSKNRAFYRVVAAHSHHRRDGRFIELLGTYDPHQGPDKADLKMDRIEYWLGTGAKASDTVRSLVQRARKAAPAA